MQFVNWSRAVGGAVNSLIMHQHRHAVSRETQVQLHSGCPVPTGLEQAITGGVEGGKKKKSYLCKTKMYRQFVAQGFTQKEKMSLQKWESVTQLVSAVI